MCWSAIPCLRARSSPIRCGEYQRRRTQPTVHPGVPGRLRYPGRRFFSVTSKGFAGAPWRWPEDAAMNAEDNLAMSRVRQLHARKERRTLAAVLVIMLMCIGAFPALVSIVHSAAAVQHTADPSAIVNNFHSAVSIMLSVMYGQAFALLEQRCKGVVTNLYQEITVLEHIVDEAVYAAGNQCEAVLKAVKQYVKHHLLHPEDLSPAFTQNTPLTRLRSEARSLQSDGIDANKILYLTEDLAYIQSARQAAAIHSLPAMYWVLLFAMAALWLLSTLLFARANQDLGTWGCAFLFSVVGGITAAMLATLIDLSDPFSGLYSATKDIIPRTTGLLQSVNANINRIRNKNSNQINPFVKRSRPLHVESPAT